jgi:hypothetical protein
MTDRTHDHLRGAVEVWTRSYLWTPADAITFKPALCGKVYGDGRALFGLTTMNLRPRYYVIRGDSQWSCESDSNVPYLELGPNDFGQFTDEILTALGDQLGDARCGYSGVSRYLCREDRCCDCEQCQDPSVAQWPELDDEGGCSWGRLKWPAGFPTVRHPWAWRGNLLVEGWRP